MKSKSKASILSNGKTFLQILKRLKSYKALFIFSLLLSALAVGLTLYVPILVGQAIDLALSAGNVDIGGIFKKLFVILLCICSTAVIQWLVNILNNRMVYGLLRNIRREVFEKIQSFPISFIDTHQSGDIVNRIITDADQFADGLLIGFTQFFSGIMTIIGTLIFMLTINPIIALLVVILTPLSLFVAAFIANKTHLMFLKQSEIRGKQTALIDEMISEHKTVVAFGYEDEAINRFTSANNDLASASLKAIFFSSITNPSTRFINSIVYTLVAFSGAMMCIAGGAAITVGKLSSVLSYSTQYTKPFNEISGVIAELQGALACASRFFELLDAPSESSDEQANTVVSTEVIEFDSVSFSYTPDKPLIGEFNFKAQRGQHVAIVGPTGCGKTTLINLLLRFYDVNSGRILIDGTDIRSISRKGLRDKFGMVLQDTWLLEGTIRENIAFGRPDATEDQIVAAATAAHAHGFIKKLPLGYDTKIGEEGELLSQGQKQLLCIARIMLTSPEILILDEATSSIDTRTEMKIQKAFNMLMKNKTAFIVAHRLSTIKEADVILVMNNGNVIEQGSHKELISQKGFYYSLYNSQFPTEKNF